MRSLKEIEGQKRVGPSWKQERAGRCHGDLAFGPQTCRCTQQQPAAGAMNDPNGESTFEEAAKPGFVSWRDVRATTVRNAVRQGPSRGLGHALAAGWRNAPSEMKHYIPSQGLWSSLHNRSIDVEVPGFGVSISDSTCQDPQPSSSSRGRDCRKPRANAMKRLREASLPVAYEGSASVTHTLRRRERVRRDVASKTHDRTSAGRPARSQVQSMASAWRS